MPTNLSQTSAPAGKDFVDQYVRALQFQQLPYSGLPNHAPSHAIGGLDPVSPASIGAVDLSDPRLTNSRNPLAHNTTHYTGGSDPLTASNIGACSNTDPRLSDNRFPTSHKSTHAIGGTDALTISDIGACSSTDPRLSNARTPVAHKSSHAVGGSDILSPSDIGAQPVSVIYRDYNFPATGATTADVLQATYTIPGGLLGPNGYLEGNLWAECTGSANAKRIRAYISNTNNGLLGTRFVNFNIGAQSVTAVVGMRGFLIFNRNSQSSQITQPSSSGGTGSTFSGFAFEELAIDTSITFYISIYLQKDVTSETFQMKLVRLQANYQA